MLIRTITTCAILLTTMWLGFYSFYIWDWEHTLTGWWKLPHLFTVIFLTVVIVLWRQDIHTRKLPALYPFTNRW